MSTAHNNRLFQIQIHNFCIVASRHCDENFTSIIMLNMIQMKTVLLILIGLCKTIDLGTFSEN